MPIVNRSRASSSGCRSRTSIRAHAPCEAIRAGADPILRQRIGSARAGADAAVQVVEVHVDFVAPRQIDRVPGGVQIIGREMADRELRRRIAAGTAVRAAVGQREPADVGVVTVLLRRHIRHVFVVDARRIAAQRVAELPVRVVLLGSAAVVVQLFQSAAQPQQHAEPRQIVEFARNTASPGSTAISPLPSTPHRSRWRIGARTPRT